MAENKIILWEYQKRRVCQYYECSDGHDRQYPGCEGVFPKTCQLQRFLNCVEFLNKQAWPHEIKMQEEMQDFVEWHNTQTLNKIDHYSECSCNLKDEWKKMGIKEKYQAAKNG